MIKNELKVPGSRGGGQILNAGTHERLVPWGWVGVLGITVSTQGTNCKILQWHFYKWVGGLRYKGTNCQKGY